MVSERATDGTLAFVQCMGLNDPEVVAEILEMLIERGRLTAREAAEALDISYPLVLRVINDLANRGLVNVSKLKGERGRPRKLVTLNKERILAHIEECVRRLKSFREAVEKAAEGQQAQQP